MDATAVRGITQAVTMQGTMGTTAGATTNGPSSNAPVAGGGPVAAPSQPTLLGVKLLPAPAGEPQTLHLPDGSMLVPLAKVDALGRQSALRGGQAAPAAAPTAAARPIDLVPTTGAARPAAFEPKGFLFRGDYYKKFEDDTRIDLANIRQVEEKVTRGTLDHVKEDEPELHGFGVTNVTTRRVDPNTDRDLLNINPGAYYVVDVAGVAGTGQAKSIPSVVNADGSVFVDPRLKGG
ncbi:MAG: hypothetical protein JWM86_1190 [Thermoleophilia bacterium]|nr:hypothetical protein [Thermoleophilia bacterium]